jgi:hypothetical protein
MGTQEPGSCRRAPATALNSAAEAAPTVGLGAARSRRVDAKAHGGGSNGEGGSNNGDGGCNGIGNGSSDNKNGNGNSANKNGHHGSNGNGASTTLHERRNSHALVRCAAIFLPLALALALESRSCARFDAGLQVA